MTTPTTQDANAVLMGGAGAPSAKFDEPGVTWEGKIVSPPHAYEVREYDRDNPGGGAVKKYPSGDTIMGVTIDIQTTDRDIAYEDDDGIRRLYVEGRYIKEAVRNAVKAAGAKGPEVGGYLKVTFTHREDPMDKRSRKFWTVVYTPAANAALMGDDDPMAKLKASVITPAQETARQLLGIPGMTDDQIVTVTGLTFDDVRALRAQTNDSPPF